MKDKYGIKVGKQKYEGENGGKPGCACAHPREPLRGHVTSGSPIGHAQ